VRGAGGDGRDRALTRSRPTALRSVGVTRSTQGTDDRRKPREAPVTGAAPFGTVPCTTLQAHVT